VFQGKSGMRLTNVSVSETIEAIAKKCSWEGKKMATYIILSRVSPTAFNDPKDFTKLAKSVSEQIKKECPAVKWKDSFATMGRFDVVDIVESDDPDQVAKAAMIIRAYGKSQTETMSAIPWDNFLRMVTA
jgi:uncharacterized protein with GYD domain